MTEKVGAAKPITKADVPKDVADQIIVDRIRAATAPNLGKAARDINDFYYSTDVKRPAAELSVGDALGVDQLAFAVTA